MRNRRFNSRCQYWSRFNSKEEIALALGELLRPGRHVGRKFRVNSRQLQALTARLAENADVAARVRFT